MYNKLPMQQAFIYLFIFKKLNYLILQGTNITHISKQWAFKKKLQVWIKMNETNGHNYYYCCFRAHQPYLIIRAQCRETQLVTTRTPFSSFLRQRDSYPGPWLSSQAPLPLNHRVLKVNACSLLIFFILLYSSQCYINFKII